MSPIINFHDDDKPPPPFSLPFFQSTLSEHKPEDPSPTLNPTQSPPYSPTYSKDPRLIKDPAPTQITISRTPSKHPKKPRLQQEDYQTYDDGIGDAEGEGLLFEMSSLDGTSRQDGLVEVGLMKPREESIAGKRARGQALILGTGTGRFGFQRPSKAGWEEIMELVYESTPTLLFTLLGLVFTGALLEHLSHWVVFERVDELFILVPMLANMKGNLEMNLGARLSTSANIGELDIRSIRRPLILGQLSLLQVQAIAIASLAGVVSFLLGLTMPHRVSSDDIFANATMPFNHSTFALEEPRNLAVAAGLWLGERDDPDLGYIDSFKEGYTPPGAKEFVMVLVTGVGAASLSGAILGSFMSGLVLLSRRLRINPDNICTPIASCLSDLVTLFILGIIGSWLVPYISTPLPLLVLPIIVVAGGVFIWITLKNEYVSDSIKGGWTPLLGAVTISSATGVVLDRCVDRYEGFAILAVAMTGLSGAVGSIHASRLSTILHFAEPHVHPHDDPTGSVSSRTTALALFVVSIPVQVLFVLFVALSGWMRTEWQLISSFFVVAALTVFISLFLADRLTLFFWSRGMDPDSYTLPILSSIIDLIGQVLLFVAFEIAAGLGGNVRVITDT